MKTYKPVLTEFIYNDVLSENIQIFFYGDEKGSNLSVYAALAIERF